MLITVLVIIAVAIVGFLVVVAMQPDQFRITRSATIPAPPVAVFEEVNDFHRWQAWSPWAKMDPDAKNTFAGANSGVGAIFSWNGNNKVGAGKMIILDSRPGEFIRIELEFFKPFKAVNIAEFTFKPAARNDTLVSWSMAGRNTFLSKAFVLVMNCDKMIGGQFEQGLKNLSDVTSKSMTATH